MQIAEDDYLMHYGILRRSGRYPWGSGKDPNQRSQTFLDIVDGHKKAGLSDKEIASLYDDPKIRLRCQILGKPGPRRFTFRSKIRFELLKL
jgi:hypothetical protein